jgi:hypothetical protein
MDGNGYIYFSKKTTKTGKLSSCDGAMAGNDLDFRFSRCSASLRQRLMATDVTGVSKQECDEIPPGGITVEFNMGAGEAVDVSEI